MSQLLTVRRGVEIGETIYFQMETCITCGIPFMMPIYFIKERREDHAGFCCPYGHSMVYNGPSEAQKLQNKLDQERAEHIRETERINNRLLDEINTRKKAEKQLKRLHRGVCPCCNRSFENLQRHMKHKHPEAIIPAK